MFEQRSEPIDIVRIFSRLNIGGPSLQVVSLSSELDSKYHTTLITGKVGKGEGDMSYLLEPNGHYQHVFISELGRDIHFWKDWVAFWKIVKVLWRVKPLIVHTHTSKAGLLGRLAALFSRVPIRVHTFHGHVFDHYYGGVKTFFIKQIERALGYFTTHVIAISPKQRDDLVQRFKIVPADRISIIPLGFNLNRFERSDCDKIETKRKFKLPIDKYCVGIIGRLVPIKNHSMFLRVAGKVLEKRGDIHFVIVGNGPCHDLLYKEAERMSLLSSLSFLGWQRELASLYGILDIICLTSLNEGTPVSLIEAQACGIPVVSTNVGGVQDVVFPGKNGYLLSPGDEEGFKEKILILLDQPELRQKMAGFGKKYVFNTFNKERLLLAMDRLYSRLLKESLT